MQEEAEEEGGRLYRPVVTPDGVNTDRVDEWPLVEPPFKEAFHEASWSALHCAHPCCCVQLLVEPRSLLLIFV